MTREFGSACAAKAVLHEANIERLTWSFRTARAAQFVKQALRCQQLTYLSAPVQQLRALPTPDRSPWSEHLNREVPAGEALLAVPGPAGCAVRGAGARRRVRDGRCRPAGEPMWPGPRSAGRSGC